MIKRWYEQAVIYSLDVSSFQDSDGDGRGDLRGLISRLDYLSRLGVNCLWLNPIHPSPWLDNGYDISDYYGIHPALGSLGDFAELVREAQGRGIRIILDLVVNHTSDEHPWFTSAVSGLVCLERRRAVQPSPGHRIPRRAERDLDLRRAGAGLVLPSLL